MSKQIPKIGLYWYYKQKVFTYCLPINSLERSSSYVDLDIAHYEAWEFIIRENPSLSEFEYDEIQRGRVIYLKDADIFKVLLDLALLKDSDFRNSIVTAFNLKLCKAEFCSDQAYALNKNI